MLLYFNKVATIKYCPYTSIPFIGVPYNLPPEDRGMAIPHELGHYLFWNLAPSLRDIRKKHTAIKDRAAAFLAQKQTPETLQRMLLSWLEEIFCDVVGTQLGAADFVASMENFIRSSAGNADELTENDGSHPPLCVRPIAQEHALELVSGKTSGVDWNDLFVYIGQKGISELYLQASPPDFKDVVENMSREDLLKMLAASEPLQIDTSPVVRFRLDEITPTLQALVEHLNTQVNDLRQTFAAQLPTREAYFQQLFDQATDDQQLPELQEKPLAEILLHPKILEGGMQHGPHSCWAWPDGWHWVGVHNHD